MATFMNIDIEFFAASCWDAAYTARYELVCALLFFGGWLLGTLGKSKRKLESSKRGLKHISYQVSKPPQKKRNSKKVEKTGHDAVSPEASIGSIDQNLLKDGPWLAKQVVQLSSAHLPRALELYRAARQAGLELQDIAAEDRDRILMALVAATIRAGQTEETARLLTDLSESGCGVDGSLFSSVTKLCAGRHYFHECLKLFDIVSEDPAFTLTDKSACSCLLFCATEAQAHHRSDDLFERVKACGIPSLKDYGNMLRVTAQRGDWERSLSLIQEMVDNKVDIETVQYNTALATCIAAGQVHRACALLDTIEKSTDVTDVITYNTIMKGYVKARDIDHCFEVFDRMLSKGLSPSQVTYGILLDCCINENQMSQAVKVSEQMIAAGCPMNTILYTTLIKGFARAGSVKDAMNVYKQMRAEKNVLPDLITYSVLIKANCDTDHVEEALQLLEEMVSLGLKPDEVIFNNLIAGSARHGHPMLGKQLYQDMVKSRVRPSNATFSILIRLYHQCKCLEDAIALLKTEPAKHKVELEARIYVQLIQSCISERQGRRAVEVYEMMCAHAIPTVTSHNAILSRCTRINMYGTGAEIVSIAVQNGGNVAATDLRLLLEAAGRKGKDEIARGCIASMHALGHPVPAEFAQLELAEFAKLEEQAADTCAKYQAPKRHSH